MIEFLQGVIMSDTMDTKPVVNETTNKAHFGVVHSKEQEYERTEDTPDVSPTVECDNCTCTTKDDFSKLDMTNWNDWKSWTSSTWNEHHQIILIVSGVTVGVGLVGWVTWTNRSSLSSLWTSMTSNMSKNVDKSATRSVNF